MNDTFLRQLASRQSSLSPSESRVAAWVLANPGEAVSAPVQKVASEAAVSEPTVIRFCRSMGLAGYRELKTRLIASLHKAESYLHHDVSIEDGASSAAVKVLESSLNTLVDMRKQICAIPFEPAVQAVAGARQLVFAGLGASGHVAGDAAHKFFRLGLPCATALDSPTILQQAAVCHERDLVVVISRRGNWRELIDGMRLAISRGATVLAVTDPGSRLAEVADILFPCYPPEDASVYTPMSSRLAQLVLLDALQISVALAMGQAAEANLKSASAALSSGPAAGDPQ